MKQYEFVITGTFPIPEIEHPIYDREQAEAIARHLLKTGKATKVEIKEVETVSVHKTISPDVRYVPYLEALLFSLLAERRALGVTHEINGIDFTGGKIAYDPQNAFDYIKVKTEIPHTEELKELFRSLGVRAFPQA